MSDVLNQVEASLREGINKAIVDSSMVDEVDIPAIQLEKPKDKNHGDFATNIAMQMARVAKKAPKQIAETIEAHLDYETSGIVKVDIAGPGFINFFMQDAFLTSTVRTIIEQGEAYGESQAGNGKSVQVEFVSVNPTGDLHLGHARGAAYGDVLCNLFDLAGYDVEREYYMNDAGSQIDNLATSIDARYQQALGIEAAMPEDGYHGKDIIQIGEALKEEYGTTWNDKSEEERLAFFRDYGLTFEIDQIKADLDAFGVHFDQWFSEMSLYETNQVSETLTELKDKGYTYEHEGAVWFKSTEFGDDKDRVLLKSDGSYTYLMPDIAYHKNKFERGFDKIINVWGSDHHGYVPRMQAAIEALGYPSEKFSVNIIQLVNVLEDGEIVRMSKRTGKAVALRELMDDVGVDAVRYFFIMRSNDAKLDFDVDLARSQSNENPVYYVQYAHARICTMMKQAKEKGFELTDDFDESLLIAEKEKDLLKQLAAFPGMIQDAAEREAPYKVTQYVFDLAGRLHRFYNAEKVIDENNMELTKARLGLMNAVKIVIANALTVMGVNAPEKM